MISEGNITLHIPYDEQWRFAFSWCDWNNTNDWVNDFWNFECWYFDNFFTNDIALSSQILPIIVIIAHFYKDLRNGHSLNLKKKCLIFPDFYPTSTGSFIYAFKNYIRVPFFLFTCPLLSGVGGSGLWGEVGGGPTLAGWNTPPPPFMRGKYESGSYHLYFYHFLLSLIPPPPFTQICHHSFRAKCPSLCVYATATAPPVEGDIEVYTSTCLRSYCLAMSVTTPTLRVKESGEHLTYPRQLNLSCFILKGKA